MAGQTVDKDGNIYERRSPSPEREDRLQSWQDGTLILPTGKMASFKGVEYREVRDPRDAVGWVPSQYAVPAPDASARRAYVVGNTDGEGVSLRRSPGSSERNGTVPEGNAVTSTGRFEDRDGQRWLEIRDEWGYDRLGSGTLPEGAVARSICRTLGASTGR